MVEYMIMEYIKVIMNCDFKHKQENNATKYYTSSSWKRHKNFSAIDEYQSTV